MRSDNTRDYGISLPEAMVMAAFSAIAWAYTIELQFRVFTRFKRYSGAYFWSILISSWGCAIHPVTVILYDFMGWTNKHWIFLFMGISWIMIVTGQSIVLWSRLHLVVRDSRKVRWVLIMIITNFFILHVPSIIFGEVSMSKIPSAPTVGKIFPIFDRVQMTGFSIQEAIISGLYLYYTYKSLLPGSAFQKRKARTVMRNLIWVNIFILCLDVVLLGVSYAGLFVIKSFLKAAIYSLKLRLEFTVLNQLTSIVQGKSSVGGDGPSDSAGVQQYDGAWPSNSSGSGSQQQTGEDKQDGIVPFVKVHAIPNNPASPAAHGNNIHQTTEDTFYNPPGASRSEEKQRHLDHV